MRSQFRMFHVALMTGMLLLPLGCKSADDSGDGENAGENQSSVTPVTPASQEVEQRLLADNENAGQTGALQEAEESVVINLPQTVTTPLKAQPELMKPQTPAVIAMPQKAQVKSVPYVPVSLEVSAEKVEEEPQEDEPDVDEAETPQPATPLFISPSVPQVSDIDEDATHYQAGLIEASKGSGDPHKLNAFCLDAQGQIVAACGEGPGEVRVLDADGKLLNSWKLEIKPEAINVAEDGTILVGGHGKLMRFAPDGKLLASADSPHAESIRNNRAKMREEVVQQLQSRGNPRATLASRVKTYESIISQLEERKKEGKLGAQEEQILASLPKTLEIMKKQLAEQPEEEDGEPKVDEKQVESRLKYLMDSKMRVSSISADSKHVYVATYAIEGYGFNVWQVDQDFKNGKVIVENLRGCCGQMDVQVNDNGIFVAENARFRVACFDSKGELKTSWGKGDRTGAEGFTSCCNPMNVCFNKRGDVYTAESGTGRIKRFSAEGEFKDFIGDVKLVPGCKNVSIAVSPDGDRVYMLDITRNHIVLMKKKSEQAKEEKTPKVTLNQ